MSLIGATVFIAIATTVLAAGAIVTAVFCDPRLPQASKEVSDQAEMLKIQSGRLGLQERVFEEQRTINRKRDELFGKQLRESEQRIMIIERQQAEMIDLEPRSTLREVPGLDPGHE